MAQFEVLTKVTEIILKYVYKQTWMAWSEPIGKHLCLTLIYFQNYMLWEFALLGLKWKTNWKVILKAITLK